MSKLETLATVVVLVALGVAARLLPHIPNFAPVTATALFTGAYMTRRVSLVALLAILLLSDYALLYASPFGRTSFDHLYAPWELWHSTLPYVYGSFGVSALVGWYVKGHRTAGVVLLAAVFCAVQFFLITNAGVWLAGAYDRGINGLWESYVAGLPFFRGTLLGDLLYTSAFFGLYEMLRREAWERAPRSRAEASP
jgi:hypothetical protein